MCTEIWGKLPFFPYYIETSKPGAQYRSIYFDLCWFFFKQYFVVSSIHILYISVRFVPKHFILGSKSK